MTRESTVSTSMLSSTSISTVTNAGDDQDLLDLDGLMMGEGTDTLDAGSKRCCHTLIGGVKSSFCNVEKRH